SMPDCSTGAVNIKITSSTSTTSTSGVILISASEVCVWPLLLVKATRGLPFQWILVFCYRKLFHAVQKFAGEVIHARAKFAAPRCERVESNNCGYRDHKPGRGRNQRPRNPRSHSPQRGRARRAETMKCIHDAHDRPEQTDKRRNGANRSQPRQSLLQNCQRF